jgi:hypothetical protein
MARRIVVEDYTFTPSTKTIVVNRYIRQEHLTLITNVSRNQVIYNFSDPALTATSYSAVSTNTRQGATLDRSTLVYSASTGTTTIVLNYNTAGMSSTDKLQILVDEPSETFRPDEVYRDPVDKFRVSTPQSLIDTDFEYSPQPSKWESLSLSANYPSFYSRTTGATTFDVASIVGGNQSPRSTITVTTNTVHGLSVGDVVVVQDSTSAFTDGTFLVDTVGSTTTFTYTAFGVVNGSVQDSTYTTVYGGGIFDGARIPLAVSASAMTYAGTVITVTTASAHGLVPGAPILVRGVTASTNAPNGNWVVETVASPTTFSYSVAAAPTGTLASGTNFATAFLYVRPDGYQQHRALDGGVLITTGGPSNGSQMIRQTRRYFRYQSGKGVQYSTGVKFTPTFDIDTISASGNTVTVNTIQDHNLQVGTSIKIEGVVSSAGNADSDKYNITATVSGITGSKSFTYTTASIPTDTTPGGTNIFVTAVNWKGSSVRAGLYDDQNGFFFEYDGQTIYACRRDSVKELFGRVSVTNASSTVTGTNTRFLDQVVVGEYIVIKGQSYLVTNIASDTSLTIAPAYRGATRSNCRYLKTQTFRIPQSAWNMDTMDGNGPSGYNMDFSKMQMAYIDYTWYGAGHIRFGFRGPNGDVIYCHKMPNNNVNTSAYMRSGNLPGRFEAINYGPTTRLVAGASIARGSALGSSDGTLYVEDAVNWPSSGWILVKDNVNCEMIRYTSIGEYNSSARGYPISGLTRRTTWTYAGVNPSGSFASTAYQLGGTASNVTFTPDASLSGAGSNGQVSVQYVYSDCAPVVSHWGVSVIMDGRYDDDKSIIFTAGMNRYMSVAAGAQRPLLAIRIAPSADSGIGKNFGIREIVNRMQLTLNSMEVSSQGLFLIEGILNPQTITGGGLTFPTNWDTVSVGSGSLAQVVYFDGTATYNAIAATATGAFTGGDRAFAFYAENGGGANFSATSFDLSRARDLGTSILSGDGQAGTLNPGFPVGPDVLLITARNLSASTASNIAARISWTEAQA